MVIAVVRVRGRRKIKKEIEDTLRMLRLERPNHCVLVFDTPQYAGMLHKVKDYVTFGPISDNLISKLLAKRGKKQGKPLTEEDVKSALSLLSEGKSLKNLNISPVFRLRPPSKGYRDIKKPYPEGDLGKRESMDDLLKRMI